MLRRLTEARIYSYINARVKARRSQLLSMADYERLLERNLSEGLSYLGSFPRYHHLQDELSPNDLHFSIQFENKVRADFFTEIAFLCENIPESGVKFVSQYLKKSYLSVLKSILRNLDQRKSEPISLEEIFVASSEDKSELLQLSRTTQIEEAISYVQINWVQAALSSTLPEYLSQKNVLVLELALDKYFYTHLWEIEIPKLKGEDVRVTKKFIGTEIDLYNINTLLRGRVLDYPSLLIQNQMIPISFRLPDLKEILDRTSTLPDTIEVLSTTAYSDLATSLNKHYLESGSIDILDQKQKETFIQILLETTAGYPFHIGIFLSYLILRQQEIENLRIIFEAKAKAIDLDFARQLLIYYK